MMRQRIWLFVALGLILGAAAAGWFLRGRVRPSSVTRDRADLIVRNIDMSDDEARWEDEGGAVRPAEQL